MLSRLERLLRRVPREPEPDPSEPVPLRLYTAADCPLCDELKAQLAELGGRWNLVVEELDVRSDGALEERYGLSIPVLEHAGRALVKGRATTQELEDRLRRRRSSGGQGER